MDKRILVIIILLMICGCSDNNDNMIPTPAPSPVDDPLNISWQIQYTGAIDTSLNVERYHLDLFDTSEQTISLLHSRGIKVYCYISVGSWEDWRPDKNKFPKELIGKDYQGWEGEKWLDIRQIDKLAPIMTARFELCKNKGFDGIEPDNIDGYDNDTGFNISFQDQLNYNIWLAQEAHKRSLTIGLKNDQEQVNALLHYYDWAIIEDCFVQGWCDKYIPFINNKKPVFAIEYTDTGIKPEQFCPQANSMNFNAILKNRNLDAFRIACR